MKPLQGLMPDIKRGAAQSQEKPQLNEKAVWLMDKLFEQLKAIYPAWKQAMPTEKEEAEAKKVWIIAFAESGITSVEQVKAGVKVARADTNPFIPSAGQFIQWCSGVDESIIAECFDRCLAAKPAVYLAEYECARKLGYHVRTTWAASEAMKRYRNRFIEEVKVHGLEKVEDSGALKIESKPQMSDIEREIQNRSARYAKKHGKLTTDDHKDRLADIRRKLKI